MGIRRWSAIKLGSFEFMPKLLPQITATDKAIQKLTGGRLTLLRLAGLPNLTLTVPGRKSGIPRSTPLLAAPRGDSWLIAGSNFGKPGQPVWVVNLEAAERAEITVGGETTTVVPRRLEGDERASAWAVLREVWPNFDLYEQRTDREIKVFELAPA